MASIYLHIPFCRRLCGYCDFFKSVRTERMGEVVETMIEELWSERDFMSTRELSTIYFGGGTPSLLSIAQIERFIDKISDIYDVSSVSEVTLEANPDDLSEEYLRGLREVGINRLSIGVQSFDDGALKFMNRRHDAAQAVEAIEMARRVGFDNIAIDLIFGIDGYGGEILERSIAHTIELGVEHVAAYHLTIEEGTLFGRRLARGELSLVDEECSEREYEMVREGLTRGGYEHYEISNYAREGYRSRHNSAYWQGAEYLGIGAGAHSFARGERRWGAEDLERYINGGVEGRYEGEILTQTQRRNEVIMTSLRRCEGLDLNTFEQTFGTKERERVIMDAKISLECGDLIVDGDALKIPQKCFLRSDAVIEQLFFYEF